MVEIFPVKVPKDEDFLKRPYFAYGIFKKGQLAHSKIKDCVDKIEIDEIPRKMLIKDGIPLIINEYSEKITKGHKIYFKGDMAKEAYKRISDTEPEKIYKWDTIYIGDEEFNLLVGINRGGTFEYVDEHKKYSDDFDGLKDPFFSGVTEFIRNELQNLKLDDDNYIFKIQMYYMLIWSAIDRYCSLKYDVSSDQGYYLFELSNDEIFNDALDDLDLKGRNKIQSARDGGNFYYNLSRSNYIVNFYYTIRSNVVHRGKEAGNRIDELENSLDDLLNIFDYMIEKTFADDEI